ncbi:aldehyde dehydrogenase [Virgibacillus sp. W0430]|uniref:aldehyde dehydrogenase n=1 Tax=Virgibacillus sp. W0430 TaxID=3391580 RepID=UPI003F485AA1
MSKLEALIRNQHTFFRSGKSKEREFRLNALKKLREGIQLYEQHIIDALNQDLNKSEFESYSTEVGIVLEEIRFTIKNLHKWMRPKKVKTPITHIGSSSYLYAQPYGVTLILSPWNYPFQLAIAPLIGAIAAGNCAIVKPSELTPNTSNLLHRLISELFPKEYITVVQGSIEASQALLQENFDYIFFTGSVPVGKVVMEAASKTLTPVTLELGGKSPCIVHNDANLKLAAKRIAWGKYLNAGQTCVAPDYLYLHKSIATDFILHLKRAINDLYGEQPLTNPNYTRIVNEKHFNRLTAFLNEGKTVIGGRTIKEIRTIEPTVLVNITWEDTIMQDEIFGPILPVLEYDQLDQVIEGIAKHPNPLALYLFSEDKRTQQEVVKNVSFGGGCLNDTVYYIATPHLPFGGIGTSGSGAYHGKESFNTFSHHKSILKQTTRFDLPFRYPNVKNGLKKIKYFLK